MMSSREVVAPLVGDPPAEREHVERRRARERQVAVGVVVTVVRVLGVGVAEQAVADLDDLAPLLLRHAEDLREHLHRDLGGDLVHEVELALGQRAVEHLLDDLAHLLLPDADRLGREASVDECAQLVVSGRVHVDHRLARLDVLGLEVLERGAADLRGEDRRRCGARRGCPRSGSPPRSRATVGLGVPVHRILAAQLRERLVGDGLDEVVVVGEVDEVAGH